MNEIVLKEKERSLHISRIPKKTKEDFVKFADEEYVSDYGMAFKFCFDQAMEYQMMKPLIFGISQEKSNPLGEEKKDIKMMSRRIVERGSKIHG